MERIGYRKKFLNTKIIQDNIQWGRLLRYPLCVSKVMRFGTFRLIWSIGESRLRSCKLSSSLFLSLTLMLASLVSLSGVYSVAGSIVDTNEFTCHKYIHINAHICPLNI